MQIAVIGLGSFGSKLAETLHALGGEVIAIDQNEELVEDVKSRVSQAVCLDSTDEKSLNAIGMGDFDVAIVAIANDMQASILVTALLRNIGVTKIIARAISNLHEKILYQVGASQVMRIEEQMAEQAARWIISPDILKQYSFASGYSLAEVKPRDFFIGKRIKDLQLREDFNLGIAAIEKRVPAVDKNGKSVFKTEMKSPPEPDDIISRDDILVLVGLDSAITAYTESER